MKKSELETLLKLNEALTAKLVNQQIELVSALSSCVSAKTNGRDVVLAQENAKKVLQKLLAQEVKNENNK